MQVEVGILAAALVGSRLLATCRRIRLGVLPGEGLECAPAYAFAADWQEHAGLACQAGLSHAGTGQRRVRIEATWQTRSCLSGKSAGLSLALAVWAAASDRPYPSHVFCSAPLLGTDGRVGPGRPDALRAKIEYLDWTWSGIPGYVLIAGSNVRGLVCGRGRAVAVGDLSQAMSVLSTETETGGG